MGGELKAMKVFISHKREDGPAAERVCNTLKASGVKAYLDLLEGPLALAGEALTNHIKRQLNDCTDLLVVISENTRFSWWVPFEIGMASQKDFPIVNYLKAGVDLPDYLTYWPRLRSDADLVKYVRANRVVKEEALLRESRGLSVAREWETGRFYEQLRASLRQ